MIDFTDFISGKSGIEVRSIIEAFSLMRVCEENYIDCGIIFADCYEDEPYWYVNKNGELEITRHYSDMVEEVCDTWTYHEFALKHQT